MLKHKLKKKLAMLIAMLKTTHQLAGIMSSIGIILLTSIFTNYFVGKKPIEILIQISIIIGVSTMATFIPNLDKVMPAVRKRAIFHGGWFPLLVAYLCYQQQHHLYYGPILAGLFIGYTSHIVVDSLKTHNMTYVADP